MNKQNLINYLKTQKFNNKIINAFNKVKREIFTPINYKHLTYENIAIPLQKGATISQPYTIAFMLQLLNLRPNQKLLEIGSGSGYVLALISIIIKKGKIFGIEIIDSLANESKKILSKNKNIEIFSKDGSNGLKEKAPFDRILISASCDYLPKHLYKQLKNNGILVAPVKESIFQIKKSNNKISINEFPGFIFVPLHD